MSSSRLVVCMGLFGQRNILLPWGLLSVENQTWKQNCELYHFSLMTSNVVAKKLTNATVGSYLTKADWLEKSDTSRNFAFRFDFLPTVGHHSVPLATFFLFILQLTKHKACFGVILLLPPREQSYQREDTVFCWIMESDACSPASIWKFYFIKRRLIRPLILFSTWSRKMRGPW